MNQLGEPTTDSSGYSFACSSLTSFLSMNCRARAQSILQRFHTHPTTKLAQAAPKNNIPSDDDDYHCFEGRSYSLDTQLINDCDACQHFGKVRAIHVVTSEPTLHICIPHPNRPLSSCHSDPEQDSDVHYDFGMHTPDDGIRSVVCTAGGGPSTQQGELRCSQKPESGCVTSAASPIVLSEEEYAASRPPTPIDDVLSEELLTRKSQLSLEVVRDILFSSHFVGCARDSECSNSLTHKPNQECAPADHTFDGLKASENEPDFASGLGQSGRVKSRQKKRSKRKHKRQKVQHLSRSSSSSDCSCPSECLEKCVLGYVKLDGEDQYAMMGDDTSNAPPFTDEDNNKASDCLLLNINVKSDECDYPDNESSDEAFSIDDGHRETRSLSTETGRLHESSRVYTGGKTKYDNIRYLDGKLCTKDLTYVNIDIDEGSARSKMEHLKYVHASKEGDSKQPQTAGLPPKLSEDHSSCQPKQSRGCLKIEAQCAKSGVCASSEKCSYSSDPLFHTKPSHKCTQLCQNVQVQLVNENIQNSDIQAIKSSFPTMPQFEGQTKVKSTIQTPDNSTNFATAILPSLSCSQANEQVHVFETTTNELERVDGITINNEPKQIIPQLSYREVREDPSQDPSQDTAVILPKLISHPTTSDVESTDLNNRTFQPLGKHVENESCISPTNVPTIPHPTDPMLNEQIPTTGYDVTLNGGECVGPIESIVSPIESDDNVATSQRQTVSQRDLADVSTRVESSEATVIDSHKTMPVTNQSFHSDDEIETLAENECSFNIPIDISDAEDEAIITGNFQSLRLYPDQCDGVVPEDEVSKPQDIEPNCSSSTEDVLNCREPACEIGGSSGDDNIAHEDSELKSEADDGAEDSANDDEEEPPQDMQARIKRSSSLKCAKTPPGTPGRKKVVRFVDALGLDLVDVRTYLQGVPDVPKSAFCDLKLDEPATQVMTFTLAPKRIISPMFQQPGSLPDFMNRVRSQKVCLENIDIGQDLTIKGWIRVLNIDYHKTVHIRYTYDNWKSFHETQGTYVQGSYDGFSDRFSFFLCGTFLQSNGVLTFCIKYSTKDTVHWDNNRGSNYILQCYPAPPVVRTQERTFEGRPQNDTNVQTQVQKFTFGGGGSSYNAFSDAPSTPTDPWSTRFF